MSFLSLKRFAGCPSQRGPDARPRSKASVRARVDRSADRMGNLLRRYGNRRPGLVERLVLDAGLAVQVLRGLQRADAGVVVVGRGDPVLGERLVPDRCGLLVADALDRAAVAGRAVVLDPVDRLGTRSFAQQVEQVV